MSDRGLIQRAHDRLSEFEYDAVPDEGRGSANDFRVRKATDLLDDWLELHPEAPPVDPSLMRGPTPGGWLAHGRTPEVPYWPAPLWLGLMSFERQQIATTLEGVTVPVILRIGGDTSFPFVPVSKFDGTEDLERTDRLLGEITSAGGNVLLFGSDDDLPHRIGWREVIDGLVRVVSSTEHVSRACPGIEMDEWSGRDQWRRMGRLWQRAVTGVPLWCHFTQERYWNLADEGYEGILFQDKDLGHDGSVRSPFVRHAYLLDETARDYMDDRVVGSPARSALQHGWGFSYFEAGVPIQMSESFTQECIDEAMSALRKLGMPENHG